MRTIRRRPDPSPNATRTPGEFVLRHYASVGERDVIGRAEARFGQGDKFAVLHIRSRPGLRSFTDAAVTARSGRCDRGPPRRHRRSAKRAVRLG